MRYNRVICVGTIWDLDRVVYPELDSFSEQKMTRWNYVQIMGHQLCSSRKETTHVVKTTKSKMEMETVTVVNAYRIKVKAMCASCKYKKCMSDGTRVCKQMGLKVKQTFQCSQWEMADGLKNAGLQNGGVVRLKGTQEIVID
ncbi:hypothetical protein SAMN04487901_105176 [Prevotella communis]|uniref:Uncharacterized protein n=1 Tax=Prevotella communis TaxID=2913614 RepID=A0A1H0DHV1_9BACT|nr:hypothetical protein [Prevotella communis]SDG57181.1 hypothetical protein SAMN04487901_105176 [Prevotella communis]SDN69586.1 hypothetical protein SAMN04487900_10258 [Prevotella communis]